MPVLLAIAEEPPDVDGGRSCGRSWPTLPAALYVHATAPAPRRARASGTRSSGAEPHLKLALERPDLLASRAAAGRASRRPPTWPRSRRSTGRRIPARGSRRACSQPAATSASGRTGGSSASRASTSTRRRGASRRSATSRRCRSCEAGARTRSLRRPLPASCSRTGSRRSRSTSEPTTQPAIAAYARLGFEPSTAYTEASLVRSGGYAARHQVAGQRCPKWCARGSAAPTSSSATRRASAARVSTEATRMFRFSPTRS